MTFPPSDPRDKPRVRRAFARAAAGYDAAAVLQQEVERRMLERLQYMTGTPSTVLDLGSGTGHALAALRARYPRTRLVALDFALPMLDQAQRRAGLWQRLRGRQPDLVCGDMEALPLQAAAAGLIWSNLALQWLPDPRRALGEALRVLEPGGLFMFSSFGPDTLRELRAAYAEAGLNDGGQAHVNTFADMHDLGDMLVHAGYADPVMDMERHVLTYADLNGLMRDLRAIGARTVLGPRRPGLTARAALARVERQYETRRDGGRLPATFEVVYGHAWKPLPRTGPGGRRVVDIKAA